MDEEEWLDEQIDAIRELGDAGEGALDSLLFGTMVPASRLRALLRAAAAALAAPA